MSASDAKDDLQRKPPLLPSEPCPACYTMRHCTHFALPAHPDVPPTVTVKASWKVHGGKLTQYTHKSTSTGTGKPFHVSWRRFWAHHAYAWSLRPSSRVRCVPHSCPLLPQA